MMPYDAMIEAQCEPFGRECRAFARLKEMGKEHLAAKCYGYMIFDAVMEQLLADKLGLVAWGRDAKEFPQFKGRPLYGIVKEVLPHTTFSAKDARKLVQDLKEIHRCGILVADIKYDAYVGTRLVDFSFAATVPHYQFDDRFKFNRDWPITAAQDFGHLDIDVFECWDTEIRRDEPEIWVRAFYPKYEMRKHREPVFYDPRQFDWRKCANEWTKLPRRSARIEKLPVKKCTPVLSAKQRRKRKEVLRLQEKTKLLTEQFGPGWLDEEGNWQVPDDLLDDPPDDNHDDASVGSQQNLAYLDFITTPPK